VADRPLAVVLVSGGLDSCVAATVFSQTHALAFLHLNYRQRTEAREQQAFEALAAHFGVGPRLAVDLAYMEQIGGTALIGTHTAVPEDAPEPGQVPPTYVPFRNANLLGIGVAWAETLGADAVVIGAHQADSDYPDCRAGFFAAYNQMVRWGTRPERAIAVHTPLIELDKGGIVSLGARLGAPLHLTWSCYQAEDRACGRCHSCRLRLAGFAAAGLVDPIAYAA
jgi:7-cyano-7-deazaguanine synthase